MMYYEKKGFKVVSLLLILVLSLSLSGCGSTITNDANTNTTIVDAPIKEDVIEDTIVQDVQDNVEIKENNESENNESKNNESENNLIIENTDNESVKDNLIVKFIDVGQADSCIIITPNDDVILIDAGESKDALEIINSLNEYTFEDIDLMILSHPHADHIGGAETILNTYNTKEVLMCSYPATTKMFNSLLDTMEEKNIEVTQAILGKTYNIDGVNIEVVGVDSIPKDNNNSSVVVKITYGTVDMLFTGDLEMDGEKVVLSNGFDLNAEILKVGHHGSDTSTSETFLNAVSPKLCIISVGEGNKYGHPAEETLNRFKDNDIQYYRTDESGSILLEIDGTSIVTKLEDSFEMTNARSFNSFLFSPNVAEVQLETEQVVIDNALNNKK